MIFLSISSEIKSGLNKSVSDAFTEYGTVISCLTIGIILGIFIRGIMLNRNYKKAVEARISDKEQTIRDLNALLLERAERLNSEKLKDGFLARLRKLLKLRISR